MMGLAPRFGVTDCYAPLMAVLVQQTSRVPVQHVALLLAGQAIQTFGAPARPANPVHAAARRTGQILHHYRLTVSGRERLLKIDRVCLKTRVNENQS